MVSLGLDRSGSSTSPARAGAGERLRGRLRERVEGLNARLDAGGVIEDADIEDLERLGRAVAVAEAATPRRRRRPARGVAIAYLATVAVVALLLFVRCAVTEVALELQASEVEFILAETQNVMAPLAASRLALDGPHRTEVPPGFPASPLDVGEVASVLWTSAAPRGLMLNTLHLPAGTHIRLHQLQGGETLRLRLWNPDTVLGVSLTIPPEVMVKTPGPEPGVRLTLGGHRPITISVAPGQTLEVTADDAGARQFTDELLVAGPLGLHRLRDEEDVRRRPVSTVIAGALVLEEVGDRRHSLRPGEHLRVALQSGTIERLEAAADGVRLRLRGTAEVLATGVTGSVRDLRPRWIEWLQTRQETVLFGATAAYLFGVLLAFLKWVGVAE